MKTDIPAPAYRPFVDACKEHGIGRTRAYEYRKAGLLKTFKMGRSLYVWMASLNELPFRIPEYDKNRAKGPARLPGRGRT